MPDIVMPIPRTPYIVAEISKNWVNGRSPTPLLAEQFEYAIEYNRLRGYRLHSFQLHQLLLSRADEANPDDEMIETIIAVFETMEPCWPVAAVDPVPPTSVDPTPRA